MRWLALIGLVALQGLSCSSDPPSCTTDDCSIPTRSIVKWTFDSYPEWLFQGDTCLDLAIVTVRVAVAQVDDPAIGQSMDVACGQGQASLLRLEPGMYNAFVTPLDAAGTPLVTVPAVGLLAAGAPGANTEVTVNVPHTAWIGRDTFTGTFLFRLSWGGQSCEATVPPVTTQTLELRANGLPVDKVTDKGQKLDGTDPRPCRVLTEQFAQFAEGLPYGPATFHVIGKDMTGTVRFDRQFDTFVGVAKNNPTITFDLVGPDAGVDAPLDAPPDA
ncbi:MAG: hypothetical protein WKG01_23910 [Kofleriaceae bacterium]